MRKLASTRVVDPSVGDAAAAGPSHEELLEQFDFAALPAGEDIFQLNFNAAMTTLSLAALRLPSQQDLEESLQSTQGVRVNHQDVRTLARLKTLAGMGTNAKRKVEIDSGLDLPLVTMLLCATDQLLLAHEAIDYDVSWPDDYGFAYGECFSSRKKEAEALKATAEFGMQTGTLGERKVADSRMCFFW